MNQQVCVKQKESWWQPEISEANFSHVFHLLLFFLRATLTPPPAKCAGPLNRETSEPVFWAFFSRATLV